MLKVLKRYVMPMKRSNVAGSKNSSPGDFSLTYIRLLGALIAGAETVFSSYPGTLHSVGMFSHLSPRLSLKLFHLDDFYMTHSAQMTIIETTVVNYNPDLNHNIVPISVPEWIRVVVANRLAKSGPEWIENFFRFNDGTYNNQWMIADYKLFTPGQPPQPK